LHSLRLITVEYDCVMPAELESELRRGASRIDR
jgi:hypothetical protein